MPCNIVTESFVLLSISLLNVDINNLRKITNCRDKIKKNSCARFNITEFREVGRFFFLIYIHIHAVNINH